MTSSSSSSPEISAATRIETQDHFSYKNATHDEVMEELSSRFILNLPDEELASLERICFQVEQAHWFYEDFIREENPKFPSLPLKKFSAMLFHACPLLHHWSHDHEQAFNNFMQYKTRVPVCGAIMLNETWEKCLLVKGWKSSSGWGFPKGKINEDEPEPNCAVREVLEETGYNLAGQIDPQNVIKLAIKEQTISLYIVPGVPEDYPFKTKTRKEISKIEWFKLTDLPTWKRSKASLGKFYLISPFIAPLKTFVNEHKPRNGARNGTRPRLHQSQGVPDSSFTDQDTAQESSSQTSSAENGDPQTPSPHYAESFRAAPHIASETKIVHENLDPHFARLLTSLTLSAANLESEAHRAKHDIPSTQPNSIAQPPANSAPPSEPKVDRLSSMPKSSSGTVTPSATLLSSSETSRSVPSQKSKLDISTLQSPNFKQAFTSSSQQALPSPGKSPISPSTSLTKVGSSRRTSSTADISPYLARSSEVPTSAKTLKQLALLESVADESAKMAPIIAQREAVLSTAMPPVSHFIHTPTTAGGVGVLYSSKTPFPGMPPQPLSPSIMRTQPVLDPYQSRAQTSFGYRDHYRHAGSSSMNQSQWLGALNNRNVTPQLYSTPYPTNTTFTPYYHHPFAGHAAPLAQPPLAGFHPMHPMHPLSTANTFANGHLGSDPTASINPLLSIFNGNRAPLPNTPGSRPA